MIEIPKETKIKIYLQGKALKADVIDADNNEITILGAESINTFLRKIYEAENNSLGDLIREGRVRISSTKVWDRFSLAGNRFFCEVKDMSKDELLKEEAERKAREKQQKLEEQRKEQERKRAEELAKRKAEEEKARKEAEEKARKEAEEKAQQKKKDNGDQEKEEKEEKDKTKKGVKIRNFFVRAIAVAGVGWVLCWVANELFKGKPTNNETTDDNIYRVDIDEDGNQYTYNLSDEEVYEQVYNNQTGRYENLGSAIDYDDMETQLGVIDNCVIRDELFGFENIVVADDYEAIRTISNLRADVINGNLDNKKFIDILVDYIFGGNKYINGSINEEYNSLHPYGQYVAIRILQGRLQFAPDYNNGTYDFNSLAQLCDVYGSDLYQILMGLKMVK